MNFLIRKPWDLSQNQHTPPEIYRNRKLHRRAFLQMAGVAGAGLVAGGLSGCAEPTDEEVLSAGVIADLPQAVNSVFPAKRNEKFEYGRPETEQRRAAEYTNFYEFSTGKDSWRYVERFNPTPWTLEVGGLCRNPLTLDLDQIYEDFTHEERAYRHRCVERWAMCVPWTGFPLRELVKKADPKPEAKYVSFTTFERRDEARGFDAYPEFPWPYTEGLTIDEATNELAFLATGIYGEPLPKQHGAPIRLVTPWKYGFKSGKSIVKISLTSEQPKTFWTTYNPREYPFQANVDPDVPHPRWSQEWEYMLGTNEDYETVKYNGYGDYVGRLYS